MIIKSNFGKAIIQRQYRIPIWAISPLTPLRLR